MSTRTHDDEILGTLFHLNHGGIQPVVAASCDCEALMKSHGARTSGIGHTTEQAIIPMYAGVLGLDHS
jgi:hypothetical protein